jgi:hypothetical protein
MPLHKLDPMPAVRRIDTTRADCTALEIVGHVSAADVENLVGLLEGAFAVHEQVDLLIRVTEHDGVDWAEISDATVAEGRRESKRHLRRMATVGDPAWASRLRQLVVSESDTEIRHFAADEESEAWAWIGARPA